MLLFKIKVVLSHHTLHCHDNKKRESLSMCVRTLISPLCFMQLTPNV